MTMSTAVMFIVVFDVEDELECVPCPVVYCILTANIPGSVGLIKCSVYEIALYASSSNTKVMS